MIADAYAEAPRHPCGLLDNPEWQASRDRREQLYLDRRAALYAKPRRFWLVALVALYWSGVR